MWNENVAKSANFRHRFIKSSLSRRGWTMPHWKLFFSFIGQVFHVQRDKKTRENHNPLSSSFVADRLITEFRSTHNQTRQVPSTSTTRASSSTTSRPTMTTTTLIFRAWNFWAVRSALVCWQVAFAQLDYEWPNIRKGLASKLFNVSLRSLRVLFGRHQKQPFRKWQEKKSGTGQWLSMVGHRLGCISLSNEYHNRAFC